MNNKFDELTKSMTRSLTRRAALKRFGVGLAGMALACFGLANRAEAGTRRGYCQAVSVSWFGNASYNGVCIAPGGCVTGTSADCPAGTLVDSSEPSKLVCGLKRVVTSKPCSFTT